MTKPLTTPLLQARDIVFECLMVRQGALITEMVARERANNIAQALMELLEPRGNVVSGELVTVEATEEPPPVRGAVPQEETSDETTEEMARRVIR